MNIIISNSAKIPIYEQITNQIKEKIMSGELKSGESLPSMRLLAKELRISIITTKRAYEDLESAGFIESFTGRGSFVKKLELDIYREENLKIIEKLLESACNKAHESGLSQKELMELLEIIYDGSKVST